MSVLFLAKEGFLEEPRFKILLNDETGSRHWPSAHSLASRAPLPYSLLLGKLNNTKPPSCCLPPAHRLIPPLPHPISPIWNSWGKTLPSVSIYVCSSKIPLVKCKVLITGKWSFGGLQSIKIYVGSCTDTKILGPFDSYSEEMKYLISKKFRKCKPGFPFPTFSSIN